jgi:hypothetical protein
LVESQTSAWMPASPPISRKTPGSNGSPTTGVGSTLKSPVCSTRPAGVSMTRHEASGIECETGTNPTANGPTWVTCGHGCTTRTSQVSWPDRSIFDFASSPVKRRA